MTEGPDIPFEQSDALREAMRKVMRDKAERVALGFVDLWLDSHPYGELQKPFFVKRFLSLIVDDPEEFYSQLVADGKISQSIHLITGDIYVGRRSA